MSDDAVKECEVCGEPVKRLLFPVAIQFKGKGFYSTDYARRSTLGAGGSHAANGGDSGSNGGDYGSSSGSDGGESAEAAKPPATKVSEPVAATTSAKSD
jgi:predicted nucleic acid-binding Zn ribbon protein